MCVKHFTFLHYFFLDCAKEVLEDISVDKIKELNVNERNLFGVSFYFFTTHKWNGDDDYLPKLTFEASNANETFTTEVLLTPVLPSELKALPAPFWNNSPVLIPLPGLRIGQNWVELDLASAGEGHILLINGKDSGVFFHPIKTARLIAKGIDIFINCNLVISPGLILLYFFFWGG